MDDKRKCVGMIIVPGVTAMFKQKDGSREPLLGPVFVKIYDDGDTELCDMCSDGMIMPCRMTDNFDGFHFAGDTLSHV